MVLRRLVLGLALPFALVAGRAHQRHALSELDLPESNFNNASLSYFQTRDLPTGTCNSATPCANGACCGSNNLCGYSSEFCGTGCQSNCNAKSECGPYAPAGDQKCPLNVCCSEYGFCGSTSEFCVWTNSNDPKYSECSTSYGGCGAVKRPSCGGGSSASRRNVGYYESWANTRACESVAPEDLNLDGFTSINFAFAFFDASSFEITPMDSNAASLYSRFTALKANRPGLKAFISVGGWSFTDPGPTRQAFSNMASSAGNRAQFIKNIMNFMTSYGFDGVDLDWEYPGADDRGGVPADTANYVSLVNEMSAAFGSRFELTVTIPTSYWYLQHFDIANMQNSISWFNLMAYDLHGVWDAESKYVGPYIAPHTNITEIDLALDLLWRAGVDSSKVVMGQGWYGRSFTLASPSCNTPNGVCQFTGGGDPGPCSRASGILDYQEIAGLVSSNKLTPVWDHTAAVKWITWDSNQWVSYDDADTFAQKRDFANERCLGGMMVWAMDQVSQTANNGFGGAPGAAGLNITPDQQSSANQGTADALAPATGYTTDCGASCKPGTNQVTQFNGQPGQLSTLDRCPSKKYRSLCCDDKTNVGTCAWRGYRGAALSCTSGCADGETELTTNTNNHGNKGDQTCHGGLQSFCCANFKPTSNSLAQDLESAAKAAAEAAAEQAALDVAANAFCRIAVPALLAPLEALEDLIPIVGEILDLIEIAATPAIIKGCVEGIEKEGSAEFKIFGKTHTIHMDTPPTKPTSVPDRPAPSEHPPAPTGDKGDPEDSCEVKRATVVERAGPVPTYNSYTNDSPSFNKLKYASPFRDDREWDDRNGQGFALRLTTTAMLEHAQFVGGYVRISYRDRERRRCGEVTEVTRTWYRDYDATAVDVVTDRMFIPGGQITVRDLGGGWVDRIDSQGMQTSYLGQIRLGYTQDSMYDVAQNLRNNHPSYNLATNNCQTFVKRLYDAVALI